MNDIPKLLQDDKGLYLCSDNMELRADFERMIPRLKENNLRGELIVKAAKIKGKSEIRAVDATGGLGEDALLLAASGIRVRIFERNEIIYRLLEDATLRGRATEGLKEACNRMEPLCEDSIIGLQKLDFRPDIVLLDPMFPEKQKSSLTKKKLQLFQRIVPPCFDEEDLLKAAFDAGPDKIIIKRPLKGPYLGGIKPSYSYEGKTVRIDCIVL